MQLGGTRRSANGSDVSAVTTQTTMSQSPSRASPWITHPYDSIDPPISGLARLACRGRPGDAALVERFAQQILDLAIGRAQLRLRETLDLGPELRVDPQQVRLALGHRRIKCRASRC